MGFFVNTDFLELWMSIEHQGVTPWIDAGRRRRAGRTVLQYSLEFRMSAEQQEVFTPWMVAARKSFFRQ